MSLPSTARADGLLLVDKPAGVTSHDVVARARRVLRERRIGHLGTLDPFATGLLVLLVGRATRLAQYLDGEPKEYEATVAFGAGTETDDATGAVTVTAPLPASADVRHAVEQLTGPLEQMPPAYSAKQVDGERSYAAARAGRTLALRAVPVHVHPTAVIDEDVVLGEGTRVWHFVHVSSGARIGAGCVLGQNVFVGRRVFASKGSAMSSPRRTKRISPVGE